MSALAAYVPGPIWPPDWSQFVPDAIGAILTGAIIGFVLWRVDRLASGRTLRAAAESSWRIVRAGLYGAMPSTFDMRLGTPQAHHEYASRWATFLGRLDPGVAAWADALPENRELQLARQLLIDLPKLDRRLNELRREVIIALLMDGHAKAANLDRYTDYVLTRVLGGPRESEAAKAALSTGEWADREAVYQAVSRRLNVSEPLENLLDVNDRVVVDWKTLRTLLSEP